jgi:hypothetical protein
MKSVRGNQKRDYQNEKLRIRDTFSALLRNDAGDSIPDDDNVRGTT